MKFVNRRWKPCGLHVYGVVDARDAKSFLKAYFVLSCINFLIYF